MPDRKLKVFLSSTAKDLTAFRKAVHVRLAASPLFECIRQEDFGAQPHPAPALCKAQVEESDLFVGLIGMRRGWEPPDDPGKRSITEMEYDWAKDIAPRFLYVTPPGFPVPGDLREADAEHQRQLSFLRRVGSEGIVSLGNFKSPKTLADQVLDGLIAYVLAAEKSDDDIFSPTVRQRPAAFRFGLRDNKIDAVPETAEISDSEIGRDLHSELLAKVRGLHERLTRSNADQRALDSVARLLRTLGTELEDVRPGLLLSRSRSIEADLNAFNTPKGRRELFPDAISMMDDVLLSARDLLAAYPVVRQIEAEQLALSVQRDSKTVQIIRRDTDAIKRAATDSDAVTREGVAALKEHDADIDSARNSTVRASLLADHLLVVRNFASETLRAVRGASALAASALGSPLSKAGSELKGLSADSWQQVRERLPKGIGRAAEAAPTGALVALLIMIAGPIGGLGILRGGGFKELAKAIGKFAPQQSSKKKQSRSSRRTPEKRETLLGHAQILEVFTVSKIGKIAGCRVTDGCVQRSANVRLIRDNVVIHDGKLSQLKRFKDDVKEVLAGQECGMAFETFQDIRHRDVIECYRIKRDGSITHAATAMAGRGREP